MTPIREQAMAAALAIAVSSSNLAAQQRPDFSGVWVLAADSASTTRSIAATGDGAFRTGDVGSGWGSPLTIALDGTRLVVEYPFFSTYDLQPPVRFVFALDGSVTTNRVTLGHAEATLRSHSAWDGSTLVLTTTYPGPAGADARRLTTAVRHALRLESPSVLVVEATRAGGPDIGTTTTRARFTKR